MYSTLTIKKLFIWLLLLIALSACGGQTGSEPAASEDMGAVEEMDHEDGDEHGHNEEEMEMNRVPNDGAAVNIISPSNGDTFPANQQVIVEIETENFDLNEEGYHWHVYVDGESWGMVMGGNTDQPLTGLEPGEHMIEVYLSIPSHEELAEGDSIMINVSE